MQNKIKPIEKFHGAKALDIQYSIDEYYVDFMPQDIYCDKCKQIYTGGDIYKCPKCGIFVQTKPDDIFDKIKLEIDSLSPKDYNKERIASDLKREEKNTTLKYIQLNNENGSTQISICSFIKKYKASRKPINDFAEHKIKRTFDVKDKEMDLFASLFTAKFPTSSGLLIDYVYEEKTFHDFVKNIPKEYCVESFFDFLLSKECFSDINFYDYRTNYVSESYLLPLFWLHFNGVPYDLDNKNKLMLLELVLQRKYAKILENIKALPDKQDFMIQGKVVYTGTREEFKIFMMGYNCKK